MLYVVVNDIYLSVYRWYDITRKKNIPQQEGKTLLPTPNDLQGQSSMYKSVDMVKHAPPIQALISI